MENSSLNKAHQIQRHAESLIRYRKFDEAANAYTQAIELMEDTLTTIDDPRTVGSVNMQRDHLIKQRNLILLRKEQMNEKSVNQCNDCECWDLNEKIAINSTKNVINEKFVEIKDLLNLLAEKEAASVNNETDKDPGLVSQAKLLNEELQMLVNTLVEQVNSGIRNVNQKIKIKEKDEQKELSVSPNNTNNVLKIITYDSSGGTSPFVFSPCTEIYPDIPED